RPSSACRALTERVPTATLGSGRNGAGTPLRAARHRLPPRARRREGRPRSSRVVRRSGGGGPAERRPPPPDHGSAAQGPAGAPLRADSSANRDRRWAVAAASPRLVTPSFPRMLDTCTLAV